MIKTAISGDRKTNMRFQPNNDDILNCIHL